MMIRRCRLMLYSEKGVDVTIMAVKVTLDQRGGGGEEEVMCQEDGRFGKEVRM